MGSAASSKKKANLKPEVCPLSRISEKKEVDDSLKKEGEDGSSTTSDSSEKKVFTGQRSPDFSHLTFNCLQAVSDAVATLRQAGFSNKNFDKLQSNIQDHLVNHNSLLTEYMAMCEWATTPKRWLAAERPAPNAFNSLADLNPSEAHSQIEANMQTQSKLVEKLRQQYQGMNSREELRTKLLARKASERMKKSRKKAPDYDEHFARWVDSQIESNETLEFLESDNFPLKSLGAGKLTLFSFVPGSGKSEGRSVRLSNAKHKKAYLLPDKTPPAGFHSSSTASVISLHVGSAGCDLGDALWQQLFEEHQISDEKGNTCGVTNVHFEESANDRFVPRAVFVDTDASALAGIRSSGRFAQESFVEGSGSLEGNWAEGIYGQGIEVVDAMHDVIRRQMERADKVSCITLTHAVHGGAGGGIASSLMSHMSETYGRTNKFTYSLVPPPMLEDNSAANNVLNAILSLTTLLEHATLSALLDNSALRSVATSKSHGLGLDSPAFADLNRLAVAPLCAFTGSMRSSSLRESRRLLPLESMVSLIPYPRLHLVAPASVAFRQESAKCNDSDIVWQCLNQSKFVSIDASESKNIALGLYCQGISQLGALKKVEEWKQKRTCQFVDWSPTGILAGSHCGPSRVASLTNTIAFGGLVDSWMKDWEENKGSGIVEKYVLSGMTEEQIGEAVEDIAALSADFNECGMSTE